MALFAVSFVQGFLAVFQGSSFIWRHRGLWKYVWIPFLVNVILFFALGALFVTLFPDLIQSLLPSGDAWYWAVLRILLWAVGSALLAILFLLTFTVVGNIIAGPFNDLLSEKVEEMVRGIQPRPSPGLKKQVADVGRTALEEVKRLAFYLLGAVILLLWNLIPGVGQLLYVITNGIWTLLFLSLEFGDYYLLRHWIRFGIRWSHIWSQRWASLGFGAGAGLLLMIPVLNLLLIPAAVTCGTLLWIRLAPPEG